MKPLTLWLHDYGCDHRNPTNRTIHRICVPLIFFAVAGLLHLSAYHIGDALLALALVWYAFLGLKALALMLVQLGITITLTDQLTHVVAKPVTAVEILIAVFILGWIGQFYGHHLEGKRPSFLRDLQYLMIGPIWVWLGEH